MVTTMKYLSLTNLTFIFSRILDISFISLLQNTRRITLVLGFQFQKQVIRTYFADDLPRYYFLPIERNFLTHRFFLFFFSNYRVLFGSINNFFSPLQKSVCFRLSPTQCSQSIHLKADQIFKKYLIIQKYLQQMPRSFGLLLSLNIQSLY